MSKIRVLHVVPRLDYSGVSNVVVQYFKHIDNSSFTFDFLSHSSAEEFDFYEDIREKGSKILFTKTIGSIGIWRFYLNLRELISQNGTYDIVHIHIGHITGVYAMLFRFAGIKRVICHAHTTVAMKKSHEKYMPLLRLLNKTFGSQLIACERDAGDFCFGKNDYVILRNGLDFNEVKSRDSSDISSIRERLEIVDDKIVIGHVAAFYELKNQKLSVDILKELIDLGCEASLVFVGDGPTRIEVEEYSRTKGLSSRTQFLGVRNDVKNLMPIFDITILPSKFEGLPLVAIESQAAGIKCLVSDRVDKRVDLGLGLIEFAPIDEGVTPWVERIRNSYPRMIPRDTVQEALARNGYDISESVKKLESIYKELVSNNG